MYASLRVTDILLDDSLDPVGLVVRLQAFTRGHTHCYTCALPGSRCLKSSTEKHLCANVYQAPDNDSRPTLANCAILDGGASWTLLLTLSRI